MASRSFNFVQALDMKCITLPGSFAPNGVLAIDNSLNKGKGFSVARTGVGIYTVTLEDGYPQILSVNVTLQLGTAADYIVQAGQIDPLNARTAIFKVWSVSGAGLTDVIADLNNRINFVLWLKNTELTF